MKKNECLKTLLKNDFIDKTHNSIRTAFTSFNFEAIEILISFGIDPNVTLKNGKHIFIAACELHNKYLAKILMKNVDGEQSTNISLSYALCLLGSSSVLKYFLRNVKFDIKKPCRNGIEPHKALVGLPQRKALKMIKILFKNGYELDYVSDKSHATFLIDVCMNIHNKSLELISWLLENGANPFAQIPNHNNTCLYQCVKEMAKTFIYGKKIKPILHIFNKFLENKTETDQ